MTAKTGNPGHIQVYLVDDHPPIREAIRSYVDGIMDIEICGEAGTAEAAFRDIETLAPDVAVVDLSLPDAHGLDLIENLNAQCPDVEIVVYSMYGEIVYAERAIRAGASGYLMKVTSVQNLVEAIRRVNDGEVYLSPQMSARILNKVARGKSAVPSFPIDELTDRELEVFQMLGEGYDVSEIVERLNLARKTVESYRRRAKEKLDVDSVSKLLQYAIQWTSLSQRPPQQPKVQDDMIRGVTTVQDLVPDGEALLQDNTGESGGAGSA
jgi:DNA-binding NarL/FixJ family response regulator